MANSEKIYSENRAERIFFIIAALIDEYDIQTADDIQAALREHCK